MTKSTVIKFCVFLILFMISFSSFAQKAILYNFDFWIPDGFRHEIQEYDKYGNKAYIENSFTGKKELHRYLEPISIDEVHSICDSATEMLKRLYGYEEVLIMYPNNPSVTTGKVTGFPNRGFKRTAKKNKADAYISMDFKMKDNAFLGAKNRSLWWEEAGRERTIFTDVTFSFTIYNANESVINQKDISLIDELQPLFNENYNTEIVDKGFKVRKLYFTKSEIMTIYRMAEKKLEFAE
ncbi:hypothetical protein [Aestuariivivens sediminis]|uniref:hypothetical protein n=1 Tax=Aestuariivivens sediminis TaxID=2913557 RepID=UPI001F58AA66|nr:hypothetical protein [Aestuariivivens sediminis]